MEDWRKEALAKGRATRLANAAAGIKPVHRDNPKGISLRQAINAMCKECIYDPGSGNGTWRQQTDDCTCEGCPLWDVRPRSTAAA